MSNGANLFHADTISGFSTSAGINLDAQNSSDPVQVAPTAGFHDPVEPGPARAEAPDNCSYGVDPMPGDTDHPMDHPYPEA